MLPAPRRRMEFKPWDPSCGLSGVFQARIVFLLRSPTGGDALNRSTSCRSLCALTIGRQVARRFIHAPRRGDALNLCFCVNALCSDYWEATALHPCSRRSCIYRIDNGSADLWKARPVPSSDMSGAYLTWPSPFIQRQPETGPCRRA